MRTVMRATRLAPPPRTRTARIPLATQWESRSTTWLQHLRSAAHRTWMKDRATRSISRRPILAPTRSASGRSTGATAQKSSAATRPASHTRMPTATRATRLMPPPPMKTVPFRQQARWVSPFITWPQRLRSAVHPTWMKDRAIHSISHRPIPAPTRSRSGTLTGATAPKS